MQRGHWPSLLEPLQNVIRAGQRFLGSVRVAFPVAVPENLNSFGEHYGPRFFLNRLADPKLLSDFVQKYLGPSDVDLSVRTKIFHERFIQRAVPVALRPEPDAQLCVTAI